LDKNDHGKQIVVTEAAPKQPPRQNKVSNDVGASTSNNGNNGTWVPIPVASTVNITQRVPVTATTAPISTSSVSVPTPQMGPIVSSTVAAPEFDRYNNFSIPLQNVFDLITPSEFPLQRPVLELVSPVEHDDVQPEEVRKLTPEPREVEVNPLVTENTESLLDSETSLGTLVTDDVSEPLQDGVEQDHVSPLELEESPKGACEIVTRPSTGSIASVYFSVLLMLFPFEGFGLVPPLFVIIFPPFFNKIFF
jgi:hypothetical protein